MIKRIVSGGQTGADQGGLDAAISCGIPHGGWCPKERRAEDGMIPGHYQLQETASDDYTERTRANVKESDATVVFSYGELSGGSRLTAEVCSKRRKPCLVVDLNVCDNKQACRDITNWLKQEFLIADIILNVAGSRESHAPGIHDRVRDIVVMVLKGVWEDSL